MTAKTRSDAADAFEKLGHLFLSGVPFLQAVEVAAKESRSAEVRKMLRRIHELVSARQAVDDVPDEFPGLMPESASLLWKVGQRGGLEQCCLRIAAILRMKS